MFDVIFVKQLHRIVCKKEAFDTAILFNGAMIVKMVTGDIGMHLEREGKPLYTLLMNGMGADLHHKVVAPQIVCLFHIVEGFEDRGCRHTLLLDTLFMCEESPCTLQCGLLAKVKQKGVDRCRNGRFAVRSRHTDHTHLIQAPKIDQFFGGNVCRLGV